MAASSLGMRCGNTFLFQKAEVKVKTRYLRWLIEVHIRAAAGSSSAAYLDTDFGTDLELVRHKLEKQQRRDNSVRENKVEVCQDQVPPIVKNIGEVPLVVHINSSKDKGGIWPPGSPLTAVPIPIIEKKKAEPESWVGVTRRWEEGSPVPDGIILVEQLHVDDDKYNGIKDETLITTDCIGSLLGFCTHFCLVKAKCFGEIADLQLKNSWLLSQLIN
ncbi:hypothetical protein MKX03_010198 [Papaver bracteatum]|nr:hypothetical protein MKX03_010198 [Papaver bracteatum]